MWACFFGIYYLINKEFISSKMFLNEFVNYSTRHKEGQRESILRNAKILVDVYAMLTYLSVDSLSGL